MLWQIERQFTDKGKTFTQSTLELCGVQVSDGGGYTCVVESGDTTASLTTDLEVTLKDTGIVIIHWHTPHAVEL